jgi:hypothetical protein
MARVTVTITRESRPLLTRRSTFPTDAPNPVRIAFLRCPSFTWEESSSHVRIVTSFSAPSRLLGAGVSSNRRSSPHCTVEWFISTHPSWRESPEGTIMRPPRETQAAFESPHRSFFSRPMNFGECFTMGKASRRATTAGGGFSFSGSKTFFPMWEAPESVRRPEGDRESGREGDRESGRERDRGR